MVKSSTYLLLCAILSLSLFAACKAKNSNNAEELRSLLLSGGQVERSEPFNLREFSPYLDGRWIGQAVSYGCYREGQAPGQNGPSKAEILEDLNIISRHWNLIRVYNADDDTQRILEVIRENALPIKMMLGIWLEKEDSPEAKESNERNVLRGIELSNRYPEIVKAINVGNETQVFWSWHKLDSEALIRYIRIVRSYTHAPVTTADDHMFWSTPESKQVADELDFIVTHIYPIWNGKTLDNAITWMDETYSSIALVHPQKLLALGEVGWATDYNADKKGDGEQGTLVKGEVGLKAQERFLLELDEWIKQHKVVTFLFEAFDEPWKGGGKETGPNEIEKNWGVYYETREPKPSLTNYLRETKQ
jgi:exo-beta-1,3-glucanase (GH17 family)